MKKSKSILLGVALGALALSTTSCAGAFLDISDGPFDYVSGPGYLPDGPYWSIGSIFGPAGLGPMYNPLPPTPPIYNPGPIVRPRPQPVVTPNRPVTLPDNIPVNTNGGFNGSQGGQQGLNGQRPGANTRR